MSQVAEIPIVPGTPQKFSIPLSGTTYNFLLKWCSAGGYWLLDISDENKNGVLASIPLVTGSNLLEQFGYLGIVGRIYATSDFDPNAPPTFDNLGLTGHLLYITD